MPSTEQPSGSPTKSALGSSVDSGAGGHSPFLHSLHQRFRKSSSASAQSSDQTPPPQPDLRSRNEASKEAKKYLLAVVRDDWEYPSLSVKRPSTPGREPIDHRRREDGLSDVESDNSPQKRRSKKDPYKFENPDAVADYLNERRAKRRRLVEEEMTWNIGLRNWARERDAWTGAIKHRPQDLVASIPVDRETKPQLSSTLHERNTSNSTTDDSINWPCSPHSPTPENSSSIDSVDFQQSYSSTLSGLPNFQSKATHGHPSPIPISSDSASKPADPDGEPYLPIYPPLFPDTHVLRSRITPSAYPTIYSKVVLQSLAPNIPIPLTHMTRALVQGWKTEGNWPPNSTQNPAGVAGTLVDPKAVGGRLKESAFGRWRREHRHKNLGIPPDTSHRGSSSRDHGKRRSTGTGRSSIEALGMDNLNIVNGEGGTERQGRVRKSITIVKRALGVTEDNLTSNMSEKEKLAEGEVPDIGIDFEEQEAKDAEDAGERDRVLNQGLLDPDGDGEGRRRSKSWRKGDSGMVY